MEVSYKLEEVADKIFLLNFEDSYDLAMHFLRYQEYYESPNPLFRDHKFTLIDYMEWYSKEHNNEFTYATDWCGFNVPSTVLKEVFYLGISDKNKYDKEMRKIYNRIKKKVGSTFYLIGAVGKGTTFHHEMCHGFFFTKPEFKDKMSQLVSNMKEEPKNKIIDWLRGIGYTEKVFVDEVQAFMATGLPEELDMEPDIRTYIKEFEEVYKGVKV